MAGKFDSVKNELATILKDLDDAIQAEYSKGDEKIIDLTGIKSILARVDAQIVGKAEVATDMIEGDADTRAQIMQIIEDINNDIKARLDSFRETVSDRSKKLEIGRVYKTDVVKSETMQTYRQLRELEDEDGAYSLDSIDERISVAEKEQEEAEKVVAKKEIYDQLIAAGKTPDDLKTEITVEKDLYLDELKMLNDIKNFNFDEKIDEIVSLTHARIPNKKEIEKKCKELNIFLDLFTDKSIRDAFDIGTLDFKKPEDVRKRLEELRDNHNIEDQDEIANNEELQEENFENFKEFLDESDMAKLFPDEIEKIEQELGDINISVADKIKALDKFLRSSKKTITSLETTSKDDAQKNIEKAKIRVEKLKEEKERQEIIENGEPEKQFIDHEIIDLTDLGLCQYETVYETYQKYYDFGENISGNDREKIIDTLYKRIRGSATSYGVAKTNLAINVKKGNRIADFFRKLLGRPTKEDREAEVIIKAELDRRLTAQKTDIQNQETQSQAEYDEAKGKLDNAWSLSNEQREAYEKKARKIIVENRGKKKAKTVKKEAERQMFDDATK